MSMRSSFIYGYGFNCGCDEDKLIEFIKAHKNTFCQTEQEIKLYEDMLKYTNNDYDLEDFFSSYPCDLTGIEGMGSVIANIMSRESGIHFIYCLPCDDCGTEASVVFEQTYPWFYTKQEQGITEEQLHIICKQYMDELGIEGYPDYLGLEYYG